MIRYHALVIMLIVALAGCATQPRAYDWTASRALNLAKAAGLSKAKDYAASKTRAEGIGGLLDITTSALSFESVNGLDLAMGDAVGLGLLSFVFSPPAQMDRSALLAWISEDLAADKDQAALVLSEMILNASEKTLKNEGIDYRVVKAHQERLALFYPFLETSLDFELQDESCGVYKTQTVGPMPMPTFIGNGGSAYAFLAGTRSSTRRSISVAGMPIPFTRSSWRERSARRYRRQCSCMSRQSVDRRVAGRRPWFLITARPCCSSSRVGRMRTPPALWC